MAADMAQSGAAGGPGGGAMAGGVSMGGGMSFGGNGAVASGSGTVLVNNRLAGRVTDLVSCHAGNRVAAGSATVLINGLPAARVGDPTTDGAVIVAGSRNVIIGGARAGGPDLLGSAVGAQVAALVGAAKNGTPFCEECARAAAARAAAGQ